MVSRAQSVATFGEGKDARRHDICRNLMYDLHWSLGRLENFVRLAADEHQCYIVSSLVHRVPDILISAGRGDIHECARHVVFVQLP